MKKQLLFILFLLITGLGYGQSGISGKVVDKSDKKPLVNASIVLLNQDSILQHFARANENGRFEIKNIDKGDYLMLVTYPKFEIISKTLKVEDKDLKLEDIEVNSQMNLIEEVVVTQRIPIRIKGDTIEYDAASFETEKNAKLEDLLRRLPGLTVSADGQITAHGKSVSKVLIDGEEFFGYDPKIAIRNVRADAVDKVQVYERKSEEAELTGIDDGVRMQTVNVVLKEEARKGIFGNAEANYGTENLYAGSLFAAKFNRTERIGITANTSNMGSSGREGNLRMNNQIIGNPKNSDIGGNYENQFLQKRLNMNASYGYNDNSNDNERQSYNKEIIPNGGIQETNSSSKTENSGDRHNFRSRFRFRIDSTQNMDVQFNAGLTKNSSSSESSNNVSNENGQTLRDFEGNNDKTDNSNSNSIRLNYRKRLKKRGQSINLHLNNAYRQSKSDNQVYQKTNFYTEGRERTIHQNRIGDDFNNNFSGQLGFNNRINEKLNFSIGYLFNSSNGQNRTDAYNSNGNTLSNVIDSVFSQNQMDKSVNQGVNAQFGMNFEKVMINISNRTSYKNQSLIDTYRDIDLARDFWDNDINLSVNYRLSNRKSLNASYQNNYNIPTFGQLQPLQPQTDSLYIQLGNPNLKRAMRNNFRLNYNTISLLRGTNFNINGDISLVSNPIVNKRSIESNTVVKSTYVNVDGKTNWTAGLNANFNKPVFNQQVQFNIFSGLTFDNGFSYIRYGEVGDYVLNNSQNTNGNVGISFNEQNSSGLDFDINARVGLNNQNNSINSELNYTNFTSGASGMLRYFLPKKFQISSSMHYSYAGPTKLFREPITQFYTNIELSKKLLKSESLVLSLKGFDLFNTYNNINRSVSETNYSETQQQMLTRYFLVGLKWDFNKNLGKKKDE